MVQTSLAKRSSYHSDELIKIHTCKRSNQAMFFEGRFSKIIYNAFQTKSGYSKLFFFPQNLRKRREIAEGPHFPTKKSIFAERWTKNTILRKNVKFYSKTTHYIIHYLINYTCSVAHIHFEDYTTKGHQ